MAKGNGYLRVLNLLLQLFYHIVFVVTFHSAKVNMALDLHVIRLTLLYLRILRVNLELHLFVFQVIFCLYFFEPALLQGDLIFDFCILVCDLLNARFASLCPQLSFPKGLENIASERVYVQLGFTDHANCAKVLAVVLRIKLWEWKSFADTI